MAESNVSLRKETPGPRSGEEAEKGREPCTCSGDDSNRRVCNVIYSRLTSDGC